MSNFQIQEEPLFRRPWACYPTRFLFYTKGAIVTHWHMDVEKERNN